MTVAVIDYGIGNLRSVFNALRVLGREPQIAKTPAEIVGADAIVLPGVGAFGDSMENLRQRGLIGALQKEIVEGGKPFLGICIGMEVILSKSFEHGEHAGLDWITGDVVKFEATNDQPYLRVPHVGWNSVYFSRPNPLFEGLGEKQDFYFVHSYYCRPNDPDVVHGSCDYGTTFAAIVVQDNICGVQFHPEKSHKAGMALLKNWLDRVAKC